MKLMIPFRGHIYVTHRNRIVGKIPEARRSIRLGQSFSYNRDKFGFGSNWFLTLRRFRVSKLFQSVIGSRIEGRITSWVTCYDFSFATAVERSSVDMVLVGDSGAMVALGENDTSPATMDDMIRFARSVRNGTHSKPIVGDMPRGSYEASDITALDNAMRFCKEAGCEAVKLEGGGKECLSGLRQLSMPEFQR